MKVGFQNSNLRTQISNLKFQIPDFRSPIRASLARISVGIAALVSPSVAWAQTCPACYQNAAAQAPGMLQALRTGVLVMMFPSLLMFILIFGVVFRRRNSYNAGGEEGTGFYRDPANSEAPNVAAAPWKV